MPLYGLLEDGAFEPAAVTAMSAAFEGALRELGLTDRSDPMTLMVAKKIIELVRRGEQDPERLRQQAIKELTTLP